MIRAKPYLYQNGEIFINIEDIRRKTKEKKEENLSEENLIQYQCCHMTRKQNLGKQVIGQKRVTEHTWKTEKTN